nr:hypothetical protein [Candidatus Sigynarchaeota archaeon]
MENSPIRYMGLEKPWYNCLIFVVMEHEEPIQGDTVIVWCGTHQEPCNNGCRLGKSLFRWVDRPTVYYTTLLDCQFNRNCNRAIIVTKWTDGALTLIESLAHIEPGIKDDAFADEMFLDVFLHGISTPVIHQRGNK